MQPDTFLGACITITVAGCMMIAGNASHVHGFTFTDPAQMAVDIGSFTNGFFKHAILLMMINAAVLGTTAISLSSAWAYGEIRGWPHSLQLPMRKAPGFYVVYQVSVAAAAALVLIPRAPLQLIILGVQVLAGVMLPSAIIFLQLLLNDKELLGEYANKPWNNWVNWSIIIVLFILSLILAAQVAARIKDRMNRTMMMDQFTQLFQGLFAYSPRSSLSFNKSCRKMMAEGNITPASTCTPRMISCSGARGISTNAAAAATLTW